MQGSEKANKWNALVKRPAKALSILLPVIAFQSAAWAAEAPLPMKRISANSEHQLVVEFAPGAGIFPVKPNMQDFPGPNHRLVLDFTNAFIDKTQIPSAKETLLELIKTYPMMRGIRYAALANTTEPVARIVLDLPEALAIHPQIVRLEANSVIIDLGLKPEKIAGKEPVKVAPLQETKAPEPVKEPIKETVEKPTEKVINKSVQNLAAQGTEQGTAVPVTEEKSLPATALAEISASISEETTPKTPTNPIAPTKDDTTANAVKKTEIAPNTSAVLTPVPSSDTAGSATAIPVVAPAATAPTTPAPAPLPEPAAQPPLQSAPQALLQTTPAPVPEATAPNKETKNNEAGQIPLSELGIPNNDLKPNDATQIKQQYAESIRHYNQGYEYHKVGKLTEAISEYQAAIAAKPDIAQAHSNLGMIYNQQHNYKDALVEFRKALAIDPDDAITYNGIGAALRAQKDMAGAIKNWQTAASLDPKLATAQYNLGTAYEIEKDYDKALACYRQAVKKDYRLGEAYYRMGLILQKMNNLDEAITQFGKAVKVSPQADYSEDAKQRIAILNKKKTAEKN